MGLIALHYRVGSDFFAMIAQLNCSDRNAHNLIPCDWEHSWSYTEITSGCLGAIIVYKKEVMQELVQLIRKCFNYMDDCDCVLSKQSYGQIVQHRPVQILDTIRSIQ